MARSLGAVINGSFLNRLSAASKSGSQAQRAFRSNSDNGAVNQNLSSTLRFGAQVFGTAVTTLNATIDSVNLSRNALSQLGDLTDRLIKVAEKATKPGIGKQTKSKLDAEFQSIGAEFQEIVERNNLEIGKLEEVFNQIGLGPDQSKQIASIFSEFIAADGVDTLGSKETRSSNSKIPGFAFGNEPGTETVYSYSSVKLNTNGTTGGYATSVGSIYLAVDESGNNPGIETVNIQADGGLVGALLPGSSSEVTILAVNDDTGDYIFSSTDDFLGTNSDNAEQIFLADRFGNVLHQYTSFAGADAITIQDADVSGDNGTIIFSYQAGGTAYLSRVQATIGDFGSNSGTDIGGGATSYSVAIADDGIYGAAVDQNGALIMYERDIAETIDRGGTLYDQNFDFISNTGLAISYETGSGLELLTYDSGPSDILDIGGADPATLAFYQGPDGAKGAVALVSSDGTTIEVYDADDGGFTVSAASGYSITDISDGDGTGLDTIANLSIGRNENGELQLAGVGFNAESGSPNAIFLLTDQGSLGTLVADQNIDGTLIADSDVVNRAFVYQGGLTFEAINAADGGSVLPEYNTGVRTSFSYNRLEEQVSIVDQLSGPVQLLAVNNQTGYSVIETSQDLLGYNASGYSQLYLVDYYGRVVNQITNNRFAAFEFTHADISESNLQVATLGNNGTIQSVGLVTMPGYGSDPATENASQVIVNQSYGDALPVYENLRISDSGSHVAFYSNAEAYSGTSRLRLYDTATFTVNTTLSANTNVTGQFEFVNDGLIAFVEQDGALQDIKLFSDSLSEVTTTLVNDVNEVGAFTATEGRAEDFVVFYEDRAIQTLNVLSNTGILSIRNEYDGLTESIGTLSIAYDQNLGITGNLNQGTEPASFYAADISQSTVEITGLPLNKSTQNYTGALTGERTLTRLPDAYSLISDLKELKNQIENNIEVIDQAQDYLQQNVELLRATGLQFLELSNQISSEAQADDVVRKLQQGIRSNARDALGAIGNVEDVIEKALGINVQRALS